MFCNQNTTHSGMSLCWLHFFRTSEWKVLNWALTHSIPMHKSSSLPNPQPVKPSPLWGSTTFPREGFLSEISDQPGLLRLGKGWPDQARVGIFKLMGITGQVKGWWQSIAPCKAQSGAAGEERQERSLRKKGGFFFFHHPACYRGEVMNLHMLNSINSQREKSIKGH